MGARLTLLVAVAAAWAMAAMLGAPAQAKSASACMIALDKADSPLCQAPGLEPAFQTLVKLQQARPKREREKFAAAARACEEKPEEKRRACLEDKLWPQLRRLAIAADPNSLTGRYAYKAPGRSGEALIVMLEKDKAWLRVATRTEAGRTCAGTMADAWREENLAAWKGAFQPNMADSVCDFEARATAPNQILISSSARCAWICGAGADYQGAYQIKP